MAKSKNEKSADDQEMKEIKKRQAERDKKRKLRLKKKKKKLKKETKKVNKIINMPFKLLFQLSLLGSLMSFIILYFGSQTELIKSLYFSFLVFSFLSLGVGFLMIVIFYFISEQKKQEIEMAKRKDEEELKRHEKEREQNMGFDGDILEPAAMSRNADEMEMNFETMGASNSTVMADSDSASSFDMEMPAGEQELKNEQMANGQSEIEQMEERFAAEQNKDAAEPEFSLEDMMGTKLPEEQ